MIRRIMKGNIPYCCSTTGTSSDPNGYYWSKYHNSSSKQYKYHDYKHNACVWLATRFCTINGYTSPNTTRIGTCPYNVPKPIIHKCQYGNLHPFGSLLRPSMGLGQNIGNTSMGPIYPNMPRSMPMATPAYTNESLAIFQ